MTTPVLLMHMDGTNGSTVFTDSSASAHTVTAGGSPTTAVISTAEKRFGTGSLYSSPSGSGQNTPHIYIPTHSDWDFASQQFTVEMWVYKTATAQLHYLIGNDHYATSQGWGFWIWSDERLWFEVNHFSQSFYSTGTVPNNAWAHIAVVREGTGTNQTKFYINGTQSGTGTIGAIATSGLDLFMCRPPNWNVYYHAVGYFDEVRIVKGEAVYTSNFTVPTSPFTSGDAFDISLLYKNTGGSFVAVTAGLGDTGTVDQLGNAKTAYWDNPSQDRPNTEVSDEVMRISAEPDAGNENTYTLAITNATQLVASDGTGSQGDVKVEYAFNQVYTPVLLLHMDGTNGSTSFPDSSSSAHTVTAFGNAQVSTASYKFGTGSALFDGSGDGLEIADDPGFNFDGAFTVELFARTTDFSGQGGRLAQLIAHGANGTAGNWLIYHSTSPNGVTIQFNGSNLASSVVMINDGDWHHVAMTRDGSNQIRLFIDGVLTTDVTNAADVTKATPLRIGANSPGVATWNGNIDEVRIIKGAAVYTSNFTPPTTPFS